MKGEDMKQTLICLGYLVTIVIYYKYKQKIKKVIYEILPFWTFYILLGTLFKVIIEVSFK